MHKQLAQPEYHTLPLLLKTVLFQHGLTARVCCVCSFLRLYSHVQTPKTIPFNEKSTFRFDFFLLFFLGIDKPSNNFMIHVLEKPLSISLGFKQRSQRRQHLFVLIFTRNEKKSDTSSSTSHFTHTLVIISSTKLKVKSNHTIFFLLHLHPSTILKVMKF